MIFRLFVFIVIVLQLIGCKQDRLKIDISSSKVNLPLERMENELLGFKGTDYNKLNKKLLQKYGVLYELFIARMIHEGKPTDPDIGVRLKRFVEDTTIQSIYTDIKNEFSNFSQFHEGFNKAFSHYHYYFPDSSLPKIVTFYSNFNAKALPLDSTLAIGLDMYLGANNEHVKMIPRDILPQYIKDDMDKRYMIADGMKYWLLNRFYDENSGDDFASQIIALGKIMYLLDAMLPDTPDEIKIDYTKEEIEWVQLHEEQIWKTLIDEKILYTKNPTIINQFIVDGPFTKGLPKESPSKVGIWVGWQIVRDYVNENDIDVLTLLKEKNSLKILKSYKHGKR